MHEVEGEVREAGGGLWFEIVAEDWRGNQLCAAIELQAVALPPQMYINLHFFTF